MTQLHLLCATGRTKDTLSILTALLFPVSTGLIIGLDSFIFYLCLVLSIVAVTVRYAVAKRKERRDGHKDTDKTEKKEMHTDAKDWNSLMLFFWMVERIFPLGVTLRTVVYTLFVALGLTCLLTAKKSKSVWHIFNISINVLWMLYGIIMLYFLYVELH